MKVLLSMTLLFSLSISCTKPDFEENEIFKDLTKVLASSAITTHQAKISITNYEYFNTRDHIVHIYTGEINQPKKYDVEFFGDMKKSIELLFDPILKAYTYNGEVVLQIDLNCGGPADDIDFKEKNITYRPYGDERQIIIKDYKEIGSERFYSVIDPTGIYGGMKNAIVQTYRNKKNPEIITINIMPWGSRFANLDGSQHFFNRTANKVLFYNIDYYNSDNKKITDEIIRYENGSSIDINKNSYIINKLGSNYYVGTYKIQQIDFNNGRSADDLNFSTSSNPGVVEYIARHSKYPVPIIDSNIGFIFGTVDADGINRGPENAEIKAFVKNFNNLIIEIYK